jgi:hypothetical protein
MQSPFRAAAAAALAAAALATAGCAGAQRDGANGYVRAVNAAQGQFKRTFDRLATDITPTSTPQQDRRTLAAFQAAVDGTVRRLRRVRPPERVATLHERLVGEIGSYSGHIEAARRAFATREPRRIIRAQGRLVGAVGRISAAVNRTIDRINARLRD